MLQGSMPLMLGLLLIGCGSKSLDSAPAALPAAVPLLPSSARQESLRRPVRKR